MTRTNRRRTDIEMLNTFLCRERSACEAYLVCLEVSSDRQLCRALDRLRASHQSRVDELASHIRALGGEPQPHSSVWRTLARVVEDSAGRLDERTVIQALEEYSSRMLRAYRLSLSELSPEAREFIVHRILPQGQLVHRSLVTLRGRSTRRPQVEATDQPPRARAG